MLQFFVSLFSYVLLPVVGIIWFDWDWRSVILLYWLENITIGLRNVIDMARSPKMHPPNKAHLETQGFSGRVGYIFFFIFHYGLFTTVHGVFVILISLGGFRTFDSARPIEGDINWGTLLIVWGVSTVVQIVLSLLEPRDRIPAVTTLFLRPYSRIFALHFTVIGGVWLINAMDWPPIAAIFLVVLHFVLDFKNLRQARQFSRI